jgi:hypothetical protein
MNKETVEIMHAVARKLTGRSVTIRFEKTKTTRPANGAMYKGADGTPVIDIDPFWEYSPGEIFRIFTHELAHVVKHFGIMARVNTNDRTAMYHAPSKRTDAATKSREEEAEALAETWRKYAVANWTRYRDPRYSDMPGSKLNSMLKVLLFDYKPIGE